MKNSEIFEKYLVARDAFETFVYSNSLNPDNMGIENFLYLKHTTSQIYSNLNLLYFETKINKLHNEEPSERMVKIAEKVYVEIPKFIEHYTKLSQQYKKNK